ncbi:MAG: hypothetical protein M0Q29_00705 [Thiopseudomonas sp.]|nr:hypothetical protein [Thiopseudomonas sp.]MCK9464386.1 hypothetical protein [Thiopseudomonas sp.]
MLTILVQIGRPVLMLSLNGWSTSTGHILCAIECDANKSPLRLYEDAMHPTAD